MHQEGLFFYGETDGATTLWMNYRGYGFGMLFVLPPAGETAKSFLGRLTPKQFRKLYQHKDFSRVVISLPRFSIRNTYDLKPILAPMGMAPLFASVDLSRIDGPLQKGFQVSQVIHQTYLQVDEEGTRAASVTMSGATAASPPRRTVTFQADRPFLYALIHEQSGSIVFLGWVEDPRS
jgi:serpin B